MIVFVQFVRVHGNIGITLEFCFVITSLDLVLDLQAMADQHDVDDLTKGLGGLTVTNVGEEEPRPVEVKKQETEDDGYNSANSEDASSSSVRTKDEAQDEDEDDEEEEEELQPLTFVSEERHEVETIQLISRGPVPIDHDTHRYNPYARHR